MITTRLFNVSALFVIASMIWLSPQSNQSETTNSQLTLSLGDTLQGAFQVLGVPAMIQTSTQGVSELYFGSDSDKSNEPTVRINNGIVIWLNPDAIQKVKKVEMPKTGTYLGQSVEQLVRRLGQPVRFLHGAQAERVEFKSGLSVSLADGLVVGITQRR